MLSVFLASLLATPSADACGNSMHHQIARPERLVLVSYHSDAFEADSVELEVLKRHQNQIRYCYERELVKDPSLSSMSMTATVSVSAGGSVESATWADEGLHETISACVQGRLVRFQFPEQEQAWELPVTITISHARREG